MRIVDLQGWLEAPTTLVYQVIEPDSLGELGKIELRLSLSYFDDDQTIWTMTQAEFEPFCGPSGYWSHTPADQVPCYVDGDHFVFPPHPGRISRHDVNWDESTQFLIWEPAELRAAAGILSRLATGEWISDLPETTVHLEES